MIREESVTLSRPRSWELAEVEVEVRGESSQGSPSVRGCPQRLNEVPR